MNDKCKVEKSLKKFLKKKVTYTVGMLVAFLITGAIGIASDFKISSDAHASQAQAVALDDTANVTRENLLAQIAAQKAEVQAQIDSNDARLGELNMNTLDLINEGDWYSKAPYASYFLSFLTDYTKADKESKNYTKSTRMDTENDINRRSYTTGDATQNVNYKGTGWIIGNDAWNEKTVTYDNIDDLVILPVVKPPEVSEPTAPAVTFDIPETPTVVSTPAASVPGIAAINLNVIPPSVAVPAAPMVNVNVPDINIAEQNINVVLSPITVNEPMINPTFSLSVTVPTLALEAKVPPTIIEPAINDPSRTITIVEPNADPFMDYGSACPFGHSCDLTHGSAIISNANTGYNKSLIANYRLDSGIFYSGIDPDTLIKSNIAGIKNASGYGYITHDTIAAVNRTSVRTVALAVACATVSQFDISNVDMYIAGNDGSYADGNGPKGTLGIRDTGLVFNNVNLNLYGKAAAIAYDGCRPRDTSFTNMTFNAEGSDNAFILSWGHSFRYILDSGPTAQTWLMRGYSGETSGDLDITYKGSHNSVFVYRGLQPSFKINLTGNVNLEGANNYFYNLFSYAANYAKFSAGHWAYTDEMTTGIQTSNPINVYGDKNVLYFFNKKTPGVMWDWGVNHSAAAINKFAANVGIYQGELKAIARIGEYLQMNTTAATQTADGNEIGKDDKFVEGSVGVIARSGQRSGIIPTKHLGAYIDAWYTWGIIPTNTNLSDNKVTFFNGDTIHGLEVGNVDIKYGKYSKDGFMFVSYNGTVIDVAKPGTSTAYIGSLSTLINDGIDYDSNGTVSEDEAATGTIIAYSNGKWDQAVQQLGTFSILPTSDPDIAALQNAPSEINIYVPVTTTSKEGIAYFADDEGHVNVYEDTTATGHRSIIGYARNGGDVNITGNITATDNNDESGRTNKYENIGAYAASGSTVKVAGNAEINGIGAFTKGTGASIELNGSNNIIKTGINGGLASLDEGYVKFAGGTIEHKDIVAGDHAGKLPFYAGISPTAPGGTTTGKIDFTGATAVDMYSGAVFNGDAADYTAASGTTTKYNGMSNVTINLKDNGVNLGIFSGTTVTWSGVAGVITAIKSATKVYDITGANTYDWNISLVNGTLNIGADTDFTADKLKNAILEREIVNIPAAYTVTSALGNGFVMASNNTAATNGDSQINNLGTINVTGGTPAVLAAGSYVSYGQINNAGTMSVDTGVGAYGVNGSLLKNTGNINVTSQGVGMAGLARRTTAGGAVGAAEAFGVDAGATDNVIEIDNQGTINVGGTGAVAIYADNNTGAPRSKVIIKNSHALAVGDNGVGILLKGATDGGTITLTGIGSSDISVGMNAMGIYAQNSDIDLGVSYGIEAKDSSVGIYTEGNSSVSVGDYEYKYTGSTTGNGAGIYYVGNGTSTFSNGSNITVNNVGGTTGTLTGIYAKTVGVVPTADTLVNTGNIIATTGGAYGIITENVDVNNTGAISAGDTLGNGGVDIFARNASVSTIGDKTIIIGTGAIGVYAENVPGTTVAKSINVSQGIGDMTVSGNGGVGIYVADKASNMLTLANASNIVLNDSASVADRKIGIILTDANGANTNAGSITVGSNDIGIFNKNSTLTNSGTINVNYSGVSTENIGIHTVAAGNAFAVNNSSTINVSGINNIGISAQTDGINIGLLDITGSTFNLTATSMADGDIPIGIYANGNKLTVQSTSPATIVAGANTIGVYMDGDNTSSLIGDMTFSLTSDTSGKVGIGGYFLNGAYPVGPITVTSTSSAVDGSGNKIRPIGVYFGAGSSVNSSNVIVISGSDEAIGMYTGNLGAFTNNGDLTVNAKGIGAYYLNSNIINNGQVDTNGPQAYGLFFKGGTSSSTGAINVNGSQAIGVISSGGGTSYENQGAVTTNAMDSVGIAAVSGGYAKTIGSIVISDGYGAVAKDTGSIIELTGGSVTSTSPTAGLIGIAAISDGEVKINGGSINMSDDQIGVYASNATATLSSGNIIVGNNGIGVFVKNSMLNTSGTTAITMGDSGIAIYSEDSSATLGGNVNVSYTSAGNKGVGIYYKGTIPVVNNTEVLHTGNNLVHLYVDNTPMTNTANQTIQDNGIGIYGTNNAVLANAATLTLVGTDAVGIYVDGGSTLTDIGNIAGSSTGDTKVGVYVATGDVTGTNDYNFGIAGGVGLYLKNNIVSYSGRINVTGNSPSAVARTIGIYADQSLAGTISSGINVTAADAIGIYLSGTGVAGANITYTGDMDIVGNSTSDRGLGAYLAPGSTFTLGGGITNIGGINNIGFYVSDRSILNISGGTVHNSIDGIFAYLDGGVMNFAAGSMPNIDYANVIVSGVTGTITNNTAITVGNGGLQGDAGAAIINSATGTINGTTQDAKAMIGTGIGTTLTNAGNIALTGDGSVGMYVENGATGTSTGNVTVGDRSVAYFAGQGGNVNISGTASIGEYSTVMYAAGGNINYTGADILIGNNDTGIVLSDAASIVDLNGKNITAGNKGTGIYVSGTGDLNNIHNIGTLTVGANGTGIYLNSGTNTVLSNAITLDGQDSIGILNTKNNDITYNGTITSMSVGGKGIVSQGTGALSNSGTISLIGGSGVGIYGENSTAIINNIGALIDLGDGTSTAASVGMYGKPAGTIKNDGTIHLASYGVGIYGENSIISNVGTISNGMGNNTGIYGIGSAVSNDGNISLGDSSNGIFVKNGTTIVNTGNITVGDNKSAGIYGAGTTAISLNGGAITVGKESVGIATDKGDITTSALATIAAGSGSTYIYTAEGNAINNTDLVLADYGVGMYTKTGTMINNANITAGRSDVNATPVRMSVGMAAETGTVINKGIIDVPYDHGVGMAATAGGTAINDNIINVNGKNAYGMEGSAYSTLVNNGTINITGDKSRGITGLNHTTINNTGIINVNGQDTQGIYVETGSTVSNTGNIMVNGADKTGIYVGAGGSISNEGTITVSGGGAATVTGSGNINNIGDIIINGPLATIDGVAITNTGTITVNGPLDFGTVRIGGVGTNEHIGTISAETFDKGEFVILSDVTKGANKDMYIVQYLQGATNVPNNGEITAISQSVSYVVDLQKDPDDSDKISIVLVKVPYQKMLEETKAVNFGAGLDELYEKHASGEDTTELQMFQDLKDMSDDDELASTFETELRGNEYANIQDRMMDISDIFDNSYEQLQHDRLYTKDSLKIGAIVKKGESKYKNPSIMDYDMNTIGFMAVQEYDTRTYGKKWNWDIGFTQNKFDFKNSSSDETVYSLNLGLGYEQFIGESKHTKWITRGEITGNRHDIDRHMTISGNNYKNNSTYYSGIAMLKNKIRYENVSNNGVINYGIEGTLNMGVGRYWNIKENGDGMRLDMPSDNFYSVRPGIGIDVAFTQRTKGNKKISLGFKGIYEYEFGKIYDGGNEVRFRGTNSDPWELEKPKKERGIAKIGAELKVESRAGNSIGFEVMRREGRRDATTYGANFTVRLPDMSLGKVRR